MRNGNQFSAACNFKTPRGKTTGKTKAQTKKAHFPAERLPASVAGLAGLDLERLLTGIPLSWKDQRRFFRFKED
jgi:hypothetical protein